jgi:cytochrome d ubiquinol oxidase subunit II
MVKLWFGLIALTLALYAVLDGVNVGCGMLHFVVSRSGPERRQLVAALTPLWSWHEVWLLAAGGTLFVAFPPVVGVALAGFYLAVFVLIWSLLWRGLSIEFGSHLEDSMWRSFWDFGFAAASLMIAVLLGAALGNLLRGVPLESNGRFSLPFFTNFRTNGHVGILDWYTLSVAVFTFCCLAAHGASFLAFRTEGPVHDRSQRLRVRLWNAAFILLPLITVETAFVRPGLFTAMAHRPLAWLFVTGAILGSAMIVIGEKARQDGRVFAGGCALILGLLGSGAASVFPVMLYSTLDPRASVSAYAGATSRDGLVVALVWWLLALVLSMCEIGWIGRYYRQKVREGDVY